MVSSAGGGVLYYRHQCQHLLRRPARFREVGGAPILQRARRRASPRPLPLLPPATATSPPRALRLCARAIAAVATEKRAKATVRASHLYPGLDSPRPGRAEVIRLLYPLYPRPPGRRVKGVKQGCPIELAFAQGKAEVAGKALISIQSRRVYNVLRWVVAGVCVAGVGCNGAGPAGVIEEARRKIRGAHARQERQ